MFATIGNFVNSDLRPLDALVLSGVATLDFGDRVAFETVQLKEEKRSMQHNHPKRNYL